MIKHQCKLLLVVMLFFASSFSYAEVSDASVNKLLVLSGLTKQVNQFPDAIKAGLEQAKQQGTPIPDAEYSSIIKGVDKSFLPAKILNGMRVSLKKSINESEAKELLAWYESDLGKEITRAEESASTVEAYHQMMQLSQSLLADTERVEFANRIDALLGATDMAMKLQENSSIAVYSAIMSALQPNTPLNVEPFKNQMEAQKDQTRAEIKKMVTISFVYSYQKIEIEKLQKYELFIGGPTSKKFYTTVVNSMNKEFASSISKWAEALIKMPKGKNKKS